MTDTITIPRHTFTAFRLTYSTSKDISESSKVLFLGSLPDIWIEDRAPELIKGATKYVRNLIRKRFTAASDLVNSSIRSGSSRFDDDYDDKELEEGAYNIFHGVQSNSLTGKALIKALEEEDSENESDDFSEQESQDMHLHRSLSQNKHRVSYSRDVSRDTESTRDSTTEIHTPQSYEPQADPIPIIVTPSNNYDTFKPVEQSTLLQVPEENFGTGDLGESIVSSDNSFRSKRKASLKPIRPEPNIAAPAEVPAEDEKKEKSSGGVKFDLDPSQKRKISIELPQPTELADMDIAWAEKEHHAFIRRIRSIASASKGIAKGSTHEMKSRIYRKLLKGYKVGEIIRVDKFLVMTKIIPNTKSVSSYNESSCYDSRIYERWSEYFCVLRKTADVLDPVALQLYDVRRKIFDTHKPDVQFTLSAEVGAHLYSDSDKSFCLTVPQNGHVYVYIFQSHSRIKSLKALHFIKGLGQKWDNQYNVGIPDLGIAIRVFVPISEVSKSLRNSSKITIHIKQKGYRVEYSPVLQYLQDQVINELGSRNIPRFNEWLDQLENPWFCYKQYDTLAWALNNSQAFYVENHVLREKFRLEFRDRTSNATHTTTEDGKTLYEPLPIEGFLLRMTNTSGKQKSLLRAFHKVSYFYTCDHLLLYTKYYRATPPTQNNCNEVSEGKYEEVYEHSPYQLDENEHISWLGSDPSTFVEKDQAAASEFKRRSEQIVKAEGLVDMCVIRDVRKIPFEKVAKTQLMFLDLYWYSNSAKLTDESIMDSAFEIEMMNGSILKLQAPNQLVRDQWISRLVELHNYWLSRKQEDLERQILVRAKNQRSLKISEYVDSNIKQELGVNEYYHSIADPVIHCINSVAMSKCVLFSGYLFQKGKKHSNFSLYYVVLCPGFLILFSTFKRSKVSGIWKKTPMFEHYFTIPVSGCYLYSGNTTSNDLLQQRVPVDPQNPQHHATPRIYPDGWKSTEEEHFRCFTMWFGRKRKMRGSKTETAKDEVSGTTGPGAKNPGLSTMVKRLGITGKSIVFMARSRQEREMWTSNILSEIDRFARQ